MVVLREGMCPGLDEDLVRDLRAADIKTVEDVVSSDIEELAQRCSVSYKQVQVIAVAELDFLTSLFSLQASPELVTSIPLALFAIRRVLLAQHTAFPVSGADLYEELLSSTAILSTGNPSLDKLLDSGLYTGEITELSGGPGSGKSQVCFGVAVHISYHLKQSVIYIDTTGGLTASRLLQMLQAETSNTEEQMEALQRIHIFRLFNIFSLLDCLYSLRSGGLQQASVGGGSVKAVIVDSVSAVISPLLGGKQNEGYKPCYEERQRELQPGLGVSWSHIPRTRILLERVERAAPVSHSSMRSATLIKSSRQPCHIKEEFDLQWWSRSKEASSGKRKLDETDSDDGQL